MNILLGNVHSSFCNKKLHSIIFYVDIAITITMVVMNTNLPMSVNR